MLGSSAETDSMATIGVGGGKDGIGGGKDGGGVGCDSEDDPPVNARLLGNRSGDTPAAAARDDFPAPSVSVRTATGESPPSAAAASSSSPKFIAASVSLMLLIPDMGEGECKGESCLLTPLSPFLPPPFFFFVEEKEEEERETIKGDARSDAIMLSVAGCFVGVTIAAADGMGSTSAESVEDALAGAAMVDTAAMKKLSYSLMNRSKSDRESTRSSEGASATA